MDFSHQDLLFYTAVRWLSKENVLSHTYDLLEEIQMFLETHGKKTEQFLKVVQEKIFKPSLAYLADIFEALNMLHLKLQGPHSTIIIYTDAIKAFIAMLGLWERKIEVGNINAFHHLTKIMGEKPLEEHPERDQESHVNPSKRILPLLSQH